MAAPSLAPNEQRRKPLYCQTPCTANLALLTLCFERQRAAIIIGARQKSVDLVAVERPPRPALKTRSHDRVSTTFQSCQRFAMGTVSPSGKAVIWRIP